MDQNVSNKLNDGECDYSTGISSGKAPDIVELPSCDTKSKSKKTMSLLQKIKNLTELCHNIKATEEQSISDISFLVDNIILIAKEKCKRCLN